MHTPLTSHALSATTTSSEAESTDALAAPAMIAAGTRVSRELVRLMVASAFFALEAVLRMGEFRSGRGMGSKRTT